MFESKNLNHAVEQLTMGNILLVLIAQGTFQQLWGVVRAAQLLLFQALVRHNYPVHTHLFYMVCFQIADMDVFNYKKVYGHFTFNAWDTPYNKNFELYGTSDRNYLLNTGSLEIIYFMLIIHKIVCLILYVIGKKLYRWSLGRKAAMYGENVDLGIEFIKLTIEAYLEILLSGSITVFTMFEKDKPFSFYFREFGDVLGSTTCLIMFAICMALPLYILRLLIHAHRNKLLQNAEF